MDENEIYEAMGVEPPAQEPAEEPGEGQELPEGQEPGGEAPAGEPAGQEPVQEPAPVGPQGDGPDPKGIPGPTGQLPGAEPVYLAPQEVRGKVDPYSGRTINTQADYDAYRMAFYQDQQEQARRQSQEAMGRAGLDPETLNAMVRDAIAKDPAVQEARLAAQQARAREEAAQRKAFQDWSAQQLQEINALDPGADIKSLDDLAQRDQRSYQVMLGAVRGGLSLVQAYQAVHFARLAQAREQAAAQRTRNQAAGKGHLEPLGGKGGAGEDVSVPEDELQMYRDLNPGMTDAEIRKEYGKYLKEQK